MTVSDHRQRFSALWPRTHEIDDLECSWYGAIRVAMQFCGFDNVISWVCAWQRNKIEPTSVNRIGGDQHVPLDERTSAHYRSAFSHVPEILHEFPNGRIGYLHVFNVDSEKGEASALHQVGCISRV